MLWMNMLALFVTLLIRSYFTGNCYYATIGEFRVS